MSFKCDFCGEAQLPGTKPEKVVTKLRLIPLCPVQEIDPLTNMVVVRSREREEIIEEKLACPACAKTQRKPELIFI